MFRRCSAVIDDERLTNTCSEPDDVSSDPTTAAEPHRLLAAMAPLQYISDAEKAKLDAILDSGKTVRPALLLLQVAANIVLPARV